MPRYDAEWIEGMIGPRRAAASPPDQLLDLARIGIDNRVADVGCGPGFLTLPAARRVVPGGVVWALDTSAEMLRLVMSRATEIGVGSLILPLQVTEGTPLALADGEADVALCSLVLHDLNEEARHVLARELVRVTRPGGRILVVELQPSPDEQRPNRLAPDACAGILEAAGLRAGPAVALGTMPSSHGQEGMYAVVGQKSPM